MVTVIGIRFKNAGKIYYFDPDIHKINAGDSVIVETIRGIEFGHVMIGPREVEESTIVTPLKKVIRVATKEDLCRHNSNKEKQKEAFKKCEELINKNKLNMKLIDVEYTFDNNKIIFYFTADGRVDFRDLVKDLAAVFRTRIELRQIGVRDESKMLGGIGVCGRPFCCSSFLFDFQTVSIKMAKQQNLSLNPSKISGNCGRLMCCLKYENEAYEEIGKTMPKQGAIVKTAQGEGMVVEVNYLKRILRVKIEGKTPDEFTYNYFSPEEIKVIREFDQGFDEVDNLQELKKLED
jgi:cell fate regulator YaaT (PSP1 superfamily)